MGGFKVSEFSAEPKSLSRSSPYPSTTEKGVHGKPEMYIMYNKKHKGVRYILLETPNSESTAASVLHTYRISRVLLVRLSDVLKRQIFYSKPSAVKK